jgi:hypothetical protein
LRSCCAAIMDWSSSSMGTSASRFILVLW